MKVISVKNGWRKIKQTKEERNYKSKVYLFYREFKLNFGGMRGHFYWKTLKQEDLWNDTEETLLLTKKNIENC